MIVKRLLVVLLLAFVTLNLMCSTSEVFASKENEEFKDIFERKEP